MKKANDEKDTLKEEYDLRKLKVRRVGPERKGFGEVVRLAPDVAEVFPNADSVNDALRNLIQVAKAIKSPDSKENAA